MQLLSMKCHANRCCSIGNGWVPGISSLTLFFVLFWTFPLLASDFPPTVSKQHLVQYSFTIQNTTPVLVKDLDFYTFIPEESEYQKRLSIVTSPFFVKDSHNTNCLHFSIKELPPFGVRIVRVSVTCELNLRDQRHDTDGADKTSENDQNGLVSRIRSMFGPEKRRHVEEDTSMDFRAFILPSRYIESANPEVISLAQMLIGQNTLETARNIHKWVNANIHYTGYAGRIHGALYALKHRKGDCTEFSALFVALCRASNIPARSVTGFVCPGNCILKPSSMHNWAEFYIDGSWRISDPQAGKFMEHETDYVAVACASGSNCGMMNMGDEGCLGIMRFRLDGPKGVMVKMNSD